MGACDVAPIPIINNTRDCSCVCLSFSSNIAQAATKHPIPTKNHTTKMPNFTIK